MVITREMLEAAASAGMLNYGQIDRLLIFLVRQDLQKPQHSNTRRLNSAHVFYYLAVLLGVGVAISFAILAVESLGMGALFWFSTLYMLCAMGIAGWLERNGFDVHAGIFASVAMGLAPLAVFALAHFLHDADGDWSVGRALWDAMWLAAIAMGAAMLWRFRIPFLLLPITLALWFIGMDAVFDSALLTGMDFTNTGWETGKFFTLAFGLFLLSMGLLLDIRSRSRHKDRKDYAFWLYFSGLMAFCDVLPTMDIDMSVVIAIDVVLIMIGAILRRRIFAVFGVAVIALMLGNVLRVMLPDSLTFFAALALLGVVLIMAGVVWRWYEVKIGMKLRSILLPKRWSKLLRGRIS